jgi:hypothetical protein
MRYIVCITSMFLEDDPTLGILKFILFVTGMFPVIASIAAVELEHFQGWAD